MKPMPTLSAFSVQRRLGLTVLLLTLTSVTVGCATISTVREAQGTGTAKVYSISLSDLAPKARKALGGLGLQIVETETSTDGKKVSVLAEKGLSAFSYGERVAVFLTELGPQETKVEVVSKKVLATNIFAKTWTADIFKALDALVGGTR